jgi:hypothetical protein
VRLRHWDPWREGDLGLYADHAHHGCLGKGLPHFPLIPRTWTCWGSARKLLRADHLRWGNRGSGRVPGAAPEPAVRPQAILLPGWSSVPSHVTSRLRPCQGFAGCGQLDSGACSAGWNCRGLWSSGLARSPCISLTTV